jgi:hypothetical protein
MTSESLRQEPITSSDASCQRTSSENTDKELEQLTNADKQVEYRREYLAQLRRRACPGCGEDTLFG